MKTKKLPYSKRETVQVLEIMSRFRLSFCGNRTMIWLYGAGSRRIMSKLNLRLVPLMPFHWKHDLSPLSYVILPLSHVTLRYVLLYIVQYPCQSGISFRIRRLATAMSPTTNGNTLKPSVGETLAR